MKWHSSSYLENRIFDSRLVKDNLLNQRNVEGDIYTQRRDYRQFQENYPWTSVNANCLEQVAGTSFPPRIGVSYQNAQPNPWRPTLGYDVSHIQRGPERPMNNQLVHTSFIGQEPTTDPITFPNLVTGFERNPQHAARAALYTRFTPGEWINSNQHMFSDSSVNRNQSERLRSEAVRIMRETDEKTNQAQRDAGRRLGERITDVTFWRNELNSEHEKLVSEIAMLTDTKRDVAKALQDLEAPLHIGQECLYHREGRQGVEKVHDHVEKSLLLETDNLRHCQEKLKAMYSRNTKQLSDSRAAQHALEDDIAHKESTLGIDGVCHQLNNFSRGINYYGGVEKFDPTVSSIETWAQASNHRINRSQAERGKSSQMRSDSETLINAVATAVYDHWSNSNNSLNRRSSEMSEAKSKMQLHLHKVQQEIFDLEKHIDLLRKAIHDKSNPLKVAQTRLEARSHRQDLELCKDFAQLRLVQEVGEIHDSVANLHRKLQNSETQHQHLLRTRASLEADLKRKVNALFIDREKCLGIRRSFPVNNMIKY